MPEDRIAIRDWLQTAHQRQSCNKMIRMQTMRNVHWSLCLWCLPIVFIVRHEMLPLYTIQNHSVQYSFFSFDSKRVVAPSVAKMFNPKMKSTHSIACRLQLIKKMSKQQLNFGGNYDQSLSEYTFLKLVFEFQFHFNEQTYKRNQSSCKRCKLEIIWTSKCLLANSPISVCTQRSIWKYLPILYKGNELAFE